MKNTPRTIKDDEIDVFARFFGTILVGLRQHDLKIHRQPREHRSYARSSENCQIIAVR